MEFHEWNKIVDNILYWILKIHLEFHEIVSMKIQPFIHWKFTKDILCTFIHKNGWSFFMVETKLNWTIFHGWNNQRRWNFLIFFILKCHQISLREIHPFCHELSSTKVMNERLSIPQYELMNVHSWNLNELW
jgi:hypothetical protein